MYLQNVSPIVNSTGKNQGCTLASSSMLYNYYNSRNKSYKNYNLLSSWWINNVGMNWNSAKAKKLTNWQFAGDFHNNGLKRIYSELNGGNPVILYLI